MVGVEHRRQGVWPSALGWALPSAYRWRLARWWGWAWGWPARPGRSSPWLWPSQGRVGGLSPSGPRGRGAMTPVRKPPGTLPAPRAGAGARRPGEFSVLLGASVAAVSVLFRLTFFAGGDSPSTAAGRFQTQQVAGFEVQPDLAGQRTFLPVTEQEVAAGGAGIAAV